MYHFLFIAIKGNGITPDRLQYTNTRVMIIAISLIFLDAMLNHFHSLQLKEMEPHQTDCSMPTQELLAMPNALQEPTQPGSTMVTSVYSLETMVLAM